MKFLNIDALGNVCEYDAREAALNAAMRSPINWKVIALESSGTEESGE